MARRKPLAGIQPGEQRTITRSVNGQRRRITYEGTRPRGKRRNLRAKIVGNEPA